LKKKTCLLHTSTGLATHELHFTIIREEFKPNQKRPCEICGQIGKNYWFALHYKGGTVEKVEIGLNLQSGHIITAVKLIIKNWVVLPKRYHYCCQIARHHSVLGKLLGMDSWLTILIQVGGGGKEGLLILSITGNFNSVCLYRTCHG